MKPDLPDEDLEAQLRSSFARARVPEAPPSIRAHLHQLQTRRTQGTGVPRGAALLAAAAILIAGLAGTGLLTGSRGPRATPTPAAPAPTASQPAYVPPGPMSLFVQDQITRGDGWRLLGGAARLPGPSFQGPNIELYTDGGLAKALDVLGLAANGGGVDQSADAIVLATLLTGDEASNPGCGRIRLDDVSIDAGNGIVAVRYEQAQAGPHGSPVACLNIGIPARFAVAIPLARLPHGEFALRLNRSNGPSLITECEVSVSAPASPPPAAAGSLVDEAGTFTKGGLWARTGRTLRTSTDGGRTWHSMALPADPIDLFVGGESNIWLASAGPGSVWPYRGQGALDTLHIVISRSSDAGRSWQTSAIDENLGGTQPVLRFADLRHGYLLAAGLRFGPATSLLETSDGGATWSPVSVDTPVGGSLGSHFTIGPNGWLWAGSQGDAGPVARPILDVSRDGGRTWSDARLPKLEGDVHPNDHLLAPPAFFGPDGAVAVSTSGDGAVLVYHTSDGGAQWEQAGAFTVQASAFAAGGGAHWYLSSASSLRRTADAGRTWQDVTPSGFSGGRIDQLAFVDPTNGAALVQFGDGTGPAVLYLTRDGGTSWEPAAFGDGGG